MCVCVLFPTHAIPLILLDSLKRERIKIAQPARLLVLHVELLQHLPRAPLFDGFPFPLPRCLAPWALHKSGPDGAKVVSDHQHTSAFSHSSCKFCSRDVIRQDYCDVHRIGKHVRAVYPLSIDSRVSVAVTPVLRYRVNSLTFKQRICLTLKFCCKKLRK